MCESSQLVLNLLEESSRSGRWDCIWEQLARVCMLTRWRKRAREGAVLRSTSASAPPSGPSPGLYRKGSLAPSCIQQSSLYTTN